MALFDASKNLLGNAKATPKPLVSPLAKNILGQPLTPKPAAKPAAPAKPVAANGFGVSLSQQLNQEIANKKDNEATAALNSASPRAQAARMMKRQAGIGQLKTMHKPEAEL